MASSSTFDLARSTAQWANEIDPQFKIQAEDLQALCGGSSQLRKMLTWCQASLRNKSKIRAVLRNRQQQAEVVKVEELARLRKEQDAKLDELQALLSKQRELKGSIKKALESIRKIEGKTDRESDEFAAQLTRHQIFLQLADKREKDLKLWADTYIELCNDAPFQELENNIIDMKKISNEALETASSAVVACSAEKAAKPTAVAAKVPDNPHSRAGSAGTPLNAGLMAAGTYKQTEAEVQAHILREYLSACAVMHSVNSKHAEKMLVAEEAKDHFKIALAIEVALAEKACLRTLMTEIEGDVLQVSSGPMELQRQKVRSLQLNNRAAKIKKVIASQARKNVQLDRRLEEVNGFIFDGATLPAQLSSSTLVLDESAIHHPSSLPADPSHGAHGDRHEGEGEGYGGSLCDLLDAEIGELCGAVSAVSGCWLAQSQVLARIPVSALRRIVPERSAVHFDPSDGAGVAISLPVPVEDYASQQAADGSSLFRLVSAELGVPPSLSAQASLEVAAAIGENVSCFHAIDDVTDDAVSGLTYTQVAAELCLATETLRRSTGTTTTTDATGAAVAADRSSATATGSDAHSYTAHSLVDQLAVMAGRLSGCMADASTLRACLQALRTEEKLTEIAVRDYDDRPAENLV